MKQRKLFKSESGFTIIEVVIVLAIAAAIMLIVFLAVPALQRNNRNTQRNEDAAKIAAAVTECLSNKNGQVASCDTAGEMAPFLDTTKLATITTVFAGAPSSSAAQIQFGLAAGGCNAAGDAVAAGQSTRSFSVLFQLEAATGANPTRCLSS